MPVEFKDIDLRFKMHPIKNEVVPLRGEQAINKSIRNLFFRDRRAIPFEPEREINIRSLLFEPMTGGVAATLENRILLVLEQFEPRIRVVHLTVIPYPNDNRYAVVLQYQIVATGEDGELREIFERLA